MAVSARVGSMATLAAARQGVNRFSASASASSATSRGAALHQLGAGDQGPVLIRSGLALRRRGAWRPHSNDTGDRQLATARLHLISARPLARAPAASGLKGRDGPWRR